MLGKRETTRYVGHRDFQTGYIVIWLYYNIGDIFAIIIISSEIKVKKQRILKAAKEKTCHIQGNPL
jgi:hypothetical protein